MSPATALTPLGSVLVPGQPCEPDLPHGDPDQLGTTSRRLLAVGQSLHDAKARLTQTTQGLSGRRAWCGTASQAFQQRSDETSHWLDNAARAMAVVAAALLAYAHTLAEASAALHQLRTRVRDVLTELAALISAVERATSARAALPFGGDVFDPVTVSLQRRADELGVEIRAMHLAAEQATSRAQQAERRAAVAFDEAAAMTLAARERAALAQAGRLGDAPPSPWLMAGELIGLGLTDLALGVADAAQAGLDPITDAAELASLARTRAVAGRLLGRAAEEEAAAALEAGAVQAAEREALSAVEHEAEADWLTAARSKLPDDWGPGSPAARGTGNRWVEPEGQGSYLRIDKGRPGHTDPVQRVDHVHIRKDSLRFGRDGEPVPDATPGLSPAERQDLIDREHVPLSDWLDWKSWWQK